MKKITLLLSVFFITLQSQAQIPAGSVAPNFTATDINGNTHTLSQYLAAGKTVIMDISATWCGPCWNYHNTKALEDLYASYGPEASNEVVVLFIEGDAATTLADINGTGTNTQGNWVLGTPYPIIDSATIASLYQITYFPTVYRICPNGLVSEVGQSSAAALRTSINASCYTAPAALVGVQNNLHALDTQNGFCSTSGSPMATIRNYGNTVTAATLTLKENGVVVGTKNYVGAVPRFASRSVTFDAVTIDPTATYTAEIVTANNNPVFSPNMATSQLGVTVASQATTDVVVKIYTDNYPSEMSWNIKNSAGAVVASGGPYAGTSAGGGVDANTTKTVNVTLPANGCYSIVANDSFGDGWGAGATPHGIEIFDMNDVSLYNFPVANFGTSSTKSNAITTATLGVETVQIKKVGVFPNPTSGNIQIYTETPVMVTIVDVLGKTVYAANQVTNDTIINLSEFQKGIYIAKIVGENTITTEKIILK